MSELMDFTAFLRVLVSQKGSDLFITSGVPPSIKLNGRIVPIVETVLTPQQARDYVLGIMNPNQREIFEKTRECSFAIAVSGIGRFRASCFFQRGQVGMVLRRIETYVPGIEELHLPPIMKTLAMSKRGIILLCGATGSGKSTTLASLVGYRNQNTSGHIITIEDPIEFVHKHDKCIVTQREVGLDTDSWESALESALLQAPDVIVMGDVRTREAMTHAISFSETGHLVLCTIHANNTAQAIERVINFFPEDRRPQLLMELSNNLKAVAAQQLIPMKDGKNRRAAIEIMLSTQLVQEYIRAGEIYKIRDVMKESVNLGMRTFDQSVFELYKSGVIDYDEALRHAESVNEVRLRIKLEQGGVDGFTKDVESSSLTKGITYLNRDS